MTLNCVSFLKYSSAQKLHGNTCIAYMTECVRLHLDLSFTNYWEATSPFHIKQNETNNRVPLFVVQYLFSLNDNGARSWAQLSPVGWFIYGQSSIYYKQRLYWMELQMHGDYAGPFLPISRGRISAPFPIKNSHLFSQYHVWVSQLRKVKKKKHFFFYFF